MGWNESERTRKVGVRTRKKFLAAGEACVAIFGPKGREREKIACFVLISGVILNLLCVWIFKGRTFVSYGFPAERTLISASAVPQYG